MRTLFAAIWVLTLTLSQSGYCAEMDQAAPVRLLVRGDDIGSSHAANVACIRSCTEGIARSLEVMVPCAWFEEAARMLNELISYADLGGKPGIEAR